MKKIVIFILAFVVLTPCSFGQRVHKKRLVPLTNQLIKDYRLTNSMVKRLQFFNGPQSIILEVPDTSKKGFVGGKGRIVLKNADVVKIKPFTRGVCTGIDNFGNLKISYERGSNSLFLKYGSYLTDLEAGYELLTLSKYEDCVWYGKEGKDLFLVTSGNESNLYIDPKNLKKFRKAKGRKAW